MLRCESPLGEETGNDHSNVATQVVFSGHNENINSMNQSENSLKSWGIGFSSNSMKFAILLWHSHCQAHCRVLRKLLHSWHLSVLGHVIPWLDVESPKVRWTGFRLNLYNFRHFGVVAEALENVILCPCLVSFCLRPKGTDDVKRQLLAGQLFSKMNVNFALKFPEDHF